MITATTNFTNALAAFRAGEITLAVEIDGHSRIYTNHDDGVGGHYPWLKDVDPLDFTVNDLDGGADQVNWGFYVLDKGAALTSDFPSFVFEGKKFTLKVGLPGLAYSDYCAFFVGKIDHVDSANNNLEYYFQCVDNSDDLNKVVYTTGDDGQETSSDHIKTLNGHPLDILLDILSSEVGMDSGFIDTAKIEEYRDGPFSGLNFVFHLQQGVAAGEFIKAQLLKPLGGYLWTNGAGKVTVNFFYPVEGPVAIGELSADSWTVIPTAEQTDMVNTVQFKFDKDDATTDASGDYRALSTQLYAPAVAKYGQYGEHVIESDGMRSGFQGFFVAALTSRLVFMRYGFKNLKFDQAASPGRFNGLLYEIGDLLSVTHLQIPDRATGTMGISNKLFEILGKHINWSEGTVTYTMIDASYLSTFGFFKITPDAQADYAASSSGDKAKYMFMTDDLGMYSNGDSGHGLG